MNSPLVVMGVSGSGKTEVGTALAARLGATFKDADDLHPLPNVQKMTAGVPLTDEDRWPWLRLVGAELAAEHPHGIVVACSALKRAYRDAIRAAAPSTRFILLKVDPSVLKDRLVQRPGHFMPASLLTSQLETLEALETAEAGMTVISEGGIEALTDQILANLRPGHLAVPAGIDQNGRRDSNPTHPGALVSTSIQVHPNLTSATWQRPSD